MKAIEFLLNATEGISCANVNDMISEFSGLTLFELENIRCTSEQHKIINFLIEFKKANDGMILSKDDYAIEQMNKFYRESLKMNSPCDKETVL